MARPLRIEIGTLLLDGEIDDTPLGEALAAQLPLESPFDYVRGSLIFPVSPLEVTGEPHPARPGEIHYRPTEGHLVIQVTGTGEPGFRVGTVAGAASLETQAGEILIRLELV
jgi:hypothetical protein